MSTYHRMQLPEARIVPRCHLVDVIDEEAVNHRYTQQSFRSKRALNRQTVATSTTELARY